jgi:hypothetical protein
VDLEIVTRAAFYATAALLIVAVIQGLKAMVPGRLHKYAPALAVGLGLLTAFGALAAFPEPPQPWPVTVLVGLAIGLGAVGAFSGVRSLAGPPKADWPPSPLGAP